MHHHGNPRQSTSTASQPPRYSTIFQDDVTELAGTSPTSNHAFSLPTTGQPWVTLNIPARPLESIPKYPIFFGGDNVSGTIDLMFIKPQIINSINLILKGRLATSTDVLPYTFLEEHHIVWEKSNGDPCSTRRFDGKLSGNHQFPFSFPFPEHVDLSSNLGGRGKRNTRNSLISPTPPTILEQSLCVDVEYQLILKITHGLLRPATKLKTIVTYIPQIIPAPPSPLRLNAYLEGTFLPGPDRDPDGWVTLPSVIVHGKLQTVHFPIDVECAVSLSLARPLSYTRGTVIPCNLTLSSQNTRALELLADPKLQSVRLTRTIQFFENNLTGLDHFSQGKEVKSVKDIAEAGLAVWWVLPKDVIQTTYTRQLQGEIHLSSELPPSSNFPLLSICYAVEILPFDTEILECTPNLNKDSDDSGAVLQSYPIEIATANGIGPIPTAFSKHMRPRHKKMASLTDPALSQFHGFSLGPTCRTGVYQDPGLYR